MFSIRSLAATAVAVASLGLALPLAAHDDHAETHPEGVIHVHDAYARVSGSKSGAVFFRIHNNTESDDRLKAASSEVARKAELHRSELGADGVMRMTALEEGLELPWGEMRELARGGDHVMLMGLTRELKQGDTFDLTLSFDKAPDLVVTVTVDNERKPESSAGEAAAPEHEHAHH